MKYQTNKYKVHVVVVEVPGDGDNFGCSSQEGNQQGFR